MVGDKTTLNTFLKRLKPKQNAYFLKDIQTSQNMNKPKRNIQVLNHVKKSSELGLPR